MVKLRFAMKKNTAMTPNGKPHNLMHSLKVHINWFVLFLLLSQLAIFPVLAQNNPQNKLIKSTAEKNLEGKNNETIQAQSQEIAFFNAATKAYNDSNFELAIDYYEKIIAAGYHSPELYYNLGNVYYKQNEIALSIYYFEKSLLLNPNDQEVIKNLGFAQKMTLDAIPTKEVNGIGKAYLRFIKFQSEDQWGFLCILLIFISVTLYLLYYFANTSLAKRFFFTAAILVFLLSGLSYLNASLVRKATQKDHPAIVFETAKVLSEPNSNGIEAFELHEGTKVQILESFSNWYKIQIADGQIGWLLQSQIRPLKE